MLAHEHVIESRCDELARMLAVDKPPGTVIQFRFSSGPDPGNAIIAHLEACGDPSLLHPEAARLHGMNIDFYAMRADAHSLPAGRRFRCGRACRLDRREMTPTVD